MNATPHPPHGPLSHLRVLDLSRVLAGPFATQNLADMGAEVIKVERPGAGDDTRAWGPPFVKAEPGARGDSAYFLSANRNKESITCDIATAEGQALIRRLAAVSDIVVENYKVGTLARYGLAYEDLQAVNPRLIYCSITGFGQTGPYAPRPGYDFVFQGMGGLMSITGVPDGEPGAGPMKVGVAVADLMTAMYATVAILAAVEQRRISGTGQHIDLALLDSLIALTSFQTLNWFVSGEVPQRLGNGHPNIVPYQVFACRDGHLILAVANDSQFRSFCRAVGKPEWADDERFAVGAARSAHRKLLCDLIAGLMLARTKHEWIELLEANNVPCGPINTIDQVFDDPQVQHRGMRVPMPHPAGPISLLASPLRFSATPVRYDLPPPLLGEHTDAVLQRVLGMRPDEIAGLRARGIV
jgi:crotonobetainyl-CoA:carnitine CoA-transferase CaiB-like acyl-CoA transferase